MYSYGTDLTSTAVTNQNKQTIKVTNNVEFNGAATIIQTCDWNDRATLLPALNSAHPTLGSSYILTNTDVEELPGSICRATLTYTCEFNSLPATSFIEETSTYKDDIQNHPNFPSWASYWVEGVGFPANTIISGENFGGVTDYYVGTTTVTMTEYFDSMPDSNHGNIGMLQVPNDAYGTYENWLIVGSTRRQEGYFWTRVTTFQYNAGGWNTEIYSEVGG